MHLRWPRLGIVLSAVLVLTACQLTNVPAPLPTLTYLPQPSATPVPTQISTQSVRLPIDSHDLATLCADLDRAWGQDWPTVIDLLTQVHRQGGKCEDKDPVAMLYPAYYNDGVALETQGDTAGAIEAFQKALSVNAQGDEAAAALKKYNAFTPMPPVTCTDEHVKAALTALPVYTPHRTGGFAQVKGQQLTIDGQPFRLRGVNYYPVRAPWRRFLAESDPLIVAKELDLIKAAGLNSLRIFLWYDGLFDCPGSGVVPNFDAFNRLDSILKLAAERGFHVIVTLNDLPDLTIRPLYSYPAIAAAQTTFIVSRYRSEPSILAWDLRNEGDVDYTRQAQTISANSVLDWLSATATQVRQIDPNHLLTAGWLSEAEVTDSAVDFLSFHHWSTGEKLQARVAAFRAVTQKPILVEEFGYSTLGVNEDQQSALLHDVISAADTDGLAGWMIWTAFDFPTDVACVPPACPGEDNGQLHFGLWHTDYMPKAAVGMLKAYAGTP